MSPTLVYVARKVLTLNPNAPYATHVAVRDGRILAVGDLADMQRWGDVELDERYIDRIIMPGLVEGHSHVMAGGLWRFPYVGFHPRTAPDGKVWEGCTNFEAVVERLRSCAAAMPESDEPLLAWGFDPIFFGGAPMTIEHLDQVSSTLPVVILHASQHLMNVNSVALGRADITWETDIEGVVKGTDGEPTGELQEFAAMFPITRMTGNIFRVAGMSAHGLQMFGQIARLAGVTTATDLVNDLSEYSMDALVEATTHSSYPCRIVPAFGNLNSAEGVSESVKRIEAARARGNDKLHPGAVKIVADGSIQGFTARLRWPGYFNGSPNGIWILPPQELRARISGFHAAGLQMHIHVNGDEATEFVIDALQRALDDVPRMDHRHTLQHCQMADAALYRRMAALGICVNLFANHLYYWGDAHDALTMGPDRARRMDACKTALDLGVHLAIHSDAPITPLGPLFTAWCAVNRQTSRGKILGAGECISVAQALHAITLGAAYTLKLDHKIGSIEIGKFADFCVLDADPESVPPSELRNIGVVATVLGGVPTTAQAPA